MQRSTGIWQNALDLTQASVLFRLPIPEKDGIPGIEEDRTRIIELPRQYRQSSEDNSLLLAEGFRDDRTESVYINDMDIEKHFYICGKTGSGKSTLLLRLIMSVIERGYGLCLIDPHEDLADAVLHRIPDMREEDVVYFNPLDKNPIAINLLENDGSEEQQDKIVQEFISMMLKLFRSDSMGPQFERGMRNTLLLLMASGSSLNDFAEIWNNKKLRNDCLDKLTDSRRNKDIMDFWRKEVDTWSGENMSGFSTYVISKFDRMNSSVIMRSILGRDKSTIDIKKIMDEGKILLVTLPKGVLGEVNANLLGMIISTKIRLAVLSRASVPEKSRKPFYLFIDEFQNFVSTSALSYSSDGYDEAFTSMISEARKYKISLILANQYLEQLGNPVRRALFGNIGSLVAFKAGVEDSRYLNDHFTDKISAEDFRTIPSYHAYASLLQDGDSLSPFTIRTIPVEKMPPDAIKKRRIIRSSCNKYGINRPKRLVIKTKQIRKMPKRNHSDD